jgi:predicted CDP-diglyceride synthetase/phosphatidate cytidylyltransferase
MKGSRLWAKTALLGGILVLMPATLGALTLTKSQDLQFGYFIGGSGFSGTVTLDTSGARRASGSVRLLGAGYSPARYALQGTPGEAYNLTLPSSLTMAAAGDQMVVTELTCSVPVSGTVPPGGTLEIALGGTVTVKATQRSSAYLGSFDLSVTGN